MGFYAPAATRELTVLQALIDKRPVAVLPLTLMFDSIGAGLRCRRGGKLKKLFAENRLEFIAVVAALAGIILISLRGRAEILLKQGYYLLVNGLIVLNHALRTDLPRYIQALPLSIVIGWLLVLLAVSFAIYRVRYRFTVSERWQASECPRCGGGLQRTRRNSIDRFLSHTLLPSARRYQCENADCRWSGLRRKRHHPDQLQLPLREVTNFRR